MSATEHRRPLLDRDGVVVKQATGLTLQRVMRVHLVVVAVVHSF